MRASMEKMDMVIHIIMMITFNRFVSFSNLFVLPAAGQAHKALSSTPSHQSSLSLTNNPSSRLAQGPGRRPRGKPGYKHIRPYSEVSKSVSVFMTVFKSLQVCYMMKTLATTTQTPCLVTTATRAVAQDQQTTATTPPAPTHLSTAEVHTP